jgi:hypothetical protein
VFTKGFAYGFEKFVTVDDNGWHDGLGWCLK